MSLNWKFLRPWHNSVNHSFEELCCQLAEYEAVPQGSDFVRKGTPDGGVECFWNLSSGSEWGWQAKFLLLPFSAVQWGELDDSVCNTLKTHPLLTRYTICLPFDRPDARSPKQKSFLDRWNDRVKKWESAASKLGRTVEFRFWGTHEISERLARPEHAGRTRFWFTSEFLSEDWFRSQLKAVIANAGERYTPALNIELPIAKVFDGLCRTASFYSRFTTHLNTIQEVGRWIPGKRLAQISETNALSLKENLDRLYRDCRTIESRQFGPLPFADLGVPALESSRRCIEVLQQRQEDLRTASVGSSTLDDSAREAQERLDGEISNVWRLTKELRNLREFSASADAIAANRVAVLVVGSPGAGKTHLLCDVAADRIRRGYPTVMLLGEQFGIGEPWQQILSLLGLDCARDEFLGALEAAAQAAGTNALILIDALNEGDGQKMWGKHLAGMLAHIDRFPRVRLALSVRSSYESLVIPPQLFSANRLLRIEHRGFEEREFEATNRFFKYFGIEPTLPHLYPEFSNPQFLMLFCRSLHNKGLTRVPTGLQGITSIFELYLDALNKKLSDPSRLNFDVADEIVPHAIVQVAKQVAKSGRRRLPVAKAKKVIDSLLPGRQFDTSLYRHLVVEGVFAEDLFSSRGKTNTDRGIRFSYERFADHIIAQHMLEAHLDKASPSKSFESGTPLGSLFSDDLSAWRNQGLIEAICIQLPEVIGKELPGVIPKKMWDRPVRRAFLESLLWRKRSAFSDETLAYINDEVLAYSETFDAFWNVVLTLSPVPDHPLNASFLNQHLARFSMAERDKWWSTFLHRRYQTESAVDRLLDWPWFSSTGNEADRNSLVLYGIALAWLFTSSNRYLRDKATKTLVRLVDKRTDVLLEILRALRDVNDPYVIERLCAVAYGTATKCTDVGQLKELGEFVYAWIFAKGTPPVHLLIRDYAKGVVEKALHACGQLNVDASKIRPPYGSGWPKQIPSTATLKARYGTRPEKVGPEEWSKFAIYDSVMGYGDFARYIIGTNSGVFEWSSTRLGKAPRISLHERYRQFIEGLSAKKGAAWRKFEAASSAASLAYFRELIEARESDPKPSESKRLLEAKKRKAEMAFTSLLSTKELATYKKYVVKYRASGPDDESRFDLSLLQRWILQRVFDLGWTVERFGLFDRDVDRGYGRESRKAERIGKKYQWIAYYECLGHVADNFEFGSEWRDSERIYRGPWQIYARDIDPSCTLLRLPEGSEDKLSTWWSPTSTYKLDRGSTREWLRNIKDLPAVEPFIEIVNPTDGSEWLTLLQYPHWEEEKSSEIEERPRRLFWYQIRSYLVRRKNANAVFSWLSKQHFWGQWMRWVNDYPGAYLGEFYWAPALDSADEMLTPETEGEKKLRALPSPLLFTAASYHSAQNSFDCSSEDPFNLLIPGKALMEGMKLNWNGVDGMYFNEKDVLVAFDPAVTTAGPHALAIRKRELRAFLDASEYSLIWTVLGAKQVMSEWNHVDWPGELQISGVYRMQAGKVVGRLRPIFIEK